MAYMSGHEKVIGIEFSSELCLAAEENLAAVKAKLSNAPTDAEIYCDDVTRYRYTDEESIFYFFYPFDNVIMERVVSNIEASITRRPRDAIIIVLYIPEQDQYTALHKSAVFKLEKGINVFGYQCRFYRTQPAEVRQCNP